MSPLVYVLSENELPDPIPVADRFFVKIGFTTSGDAQSRVKGCQTGNPRRLTVVREFEGSEIDEKTLHKLFSKYREIGEWFLLPGFLVSAIQDVDSKSADDLIDHLNAVGCQSPGQDIGAQDEALKHIHALEVLTLARDQHKTAEMLFHCLDELGDVGEITPLTILDAMATAGIKFSGGIGQPNPAYLMAIGMGAE